MTKEVTPIIAVYGALRSGSTLLRLMMNAHPDLNCPDETDFLFDHMKRVGDELDIEALQRDRIYRSHCALYGDDPGKPLSLSEMIARIAGPNEALPVLMLHRNLRQALDSLPGLQIIHLVRDPRDVARSSIGMGWAGSVYYGIHHWLKTEREWDAHAHRIAENDVITIKYEDLIADHVGVLSEICNFIGVSFDPAMQSYNKDSTYAKPDPSLTYQWKRKQTPREIGLVEAQVGNLLTDIGYSPSGHPTVVPGPLERLQLKVQHHRSVWTRRVKRFGLKDAALVYLARRLKLPKLGYAAQQRIDEKTKHYLK